MSIFTHLRQTPRRAARWLAAGGLGAAMAVALLVPAATTTLAAPQDNPCPQPVTLSCAINFGNTQIDNRTTSLNTLNGKVTAQLNAGHINSTQAGVITSDVSTNQSGLAALKTKLDADTTLTDARTDIKSIYTNFRIYAVVLPRDYNEVWLDIVTNVQGTMSGKISTIQTAINDVSNLGDKDNDGDLATINAAFSDYQAQLTAAQGQINTANGLLPQFTPANFNADPSGYKGNWDAFRAAIKSAHGDILAGASDLHKIAAVIKDLINEQGLAPGATDPNEPSLP
jgi:hypothetical protein